MSNSETRFAVLLFSDIVGSTDLKQRHGVPAFAEALRVHNAHFERAAGECRGIRILQNMGDGYFAEGGSVSEVVKFALLFQDAMRAGPWGEMRLTARVGIHAGEVSAMDAAGGSGLMGPAADLAARVMSLALGGQILLTRFPFDEARHFLREHPPVAGKTMPPLRWLAHGPYMMKGRDEPLDIFEVGPDGLAPLVPPPDGEKAKRHIRPGEEETLGWRPAVGLEIPGRSGWNLTERLGAGGFGEVWAGEHAKLRQRRAFKFCFDDERLRALKREVTLVRLLRTALGERDDIVRFHELKLDEPPFYLESDLAPHGNLLQWAEREGGLEKIPLAQRIALVAHTATALAAAHSIGVLHKDIKPTNILIFDAPEGGVRPRLVDFGIGTLADPGILAQHGVTGAGFTRATIEHSTGTPTYSPPEYLAGKPYTIQGDIYGLGVLLYQLVTANPLQPLAAGWERDIADPLLRADIAACVDGDPARRLPSAADLAERLLRLDARRAEVELEKARVTALERRAYRRGIARAAAMALGVVALVVTLAAYAFRQASVARTSSAHAERSAHAEADARGKSDEMLTRMQLQRAEELFAADDHAGGLAYLAHVLRRHPDDRLTGARLLSALRDVSHPRLILDLPKRDIVASDIQWSPDGKRLLTLRGNEVEMWDATNGKNVFGPTKTQPSAGIRFSPDGRRFLVIGIDSQIFDAETGKAVTGLLTHAGRDPVSNVPCNHAVLSPDGRLVVTTCFHPEAIVWNAENGEVVARIPMRSKAMPESADKGDWWAATAVAFSPDGALVAISRADGWMFIWEMATGSVILTEKLISAGEGHLLFAPDAKRLYVEQGRVVSAFDLSTRKKLNWAIKTKAVIYSVALAPSGRHLALGLSDRTLRFFDATTGEEEGRPATHSRYPTLVEFSQDGARVLTLTTPNGAQVWDVFTRRALVVPDRRPISSAALSPDGRRLVTASNDGSARVWGVDPAESLPTVVPHLTDRFAIHPNQRFLALNSGSSIQVWDWQTGKKIGPAMTHSPSLFSLAFTPSGDRLISGGRNDAHARIWDYRAGKETQPALPSPGYINGLNFSEDGSLLCVGGAARSARVWDLATGKPVTADLGVLQNGATITPDGGRVVMLASKNADGRGEMVAQVFDVKTSRQVGTDCVDATGYHLAISRDGRTFATIGLGGTARIWSTLDGAPLSLPIKLPSAVKDVVFSPDGKWLGLICNDPTVVVWDWKTRQIVGTPLLLPDIAQGAEFSPDGRRIATSGLGVVRVWDVATGRPSTASFGNLGTSLKWTKDSRRLVTWWSQSVSIVEVPPVDEKPLAWLADWAEAVGGQRIDRVGEIEALPEEIEVATRARLAGIEGDGIYARTLHWAFSDPATRPLSPEGTLTTPDLVAQLCAAGNNAAAFEALRLAPGDARPWAAICTSYLENAETLNDANELNLNRHLAQAEKLSPNEPMIWRARADIHGLRNRIPEAIAAARKALALRPDAPTFRQLAFLLAEHGDHVEAVEAFAKALGFAGESGFTEDEEHALHIARGESLLKAGRRDEAVRERLMADAMPLRDPKATPQQLDLSLNYNLRLDQSTSPGDWHNYARLPTGLQSFAGTLFDVRGIVLLKNVRDSRNFPEAVTGIECAQTCAKLHFLHAIAGVADNWETVIAAYIVHYSDGSQVEIPLRVAREISDRYMGHGPPQAPSLPAVAWKGANDFTDHDKKSDLYLWKYTWVNPHPELVVKTIDFVSKSENSAAFLVAITAE